MILIIGLAILVSSFLYALFNVEGAFLEQPNRALKGFKRYLLCLIGLAIGSSMTSIGLCHLIWSWFPF
jgi:hypothetical protein